MPERRPRVLMLESGGWGGIHYYAHALCEALSGLEVDLALLTNERYELEGRPPLFERLQILRRETYLLTLWKVGRLLWQKRPDLVHVQSLIAQRKDLLLLLLCRLMGVRVVMTVHNVLPHETRRFERQLYLLYYRLADALVLHAEASRKVLLELAPGLERQRLYLIAHGNYAAFRSGEPTRAQARARLHLPAERQIVLFFGAIRPYKGLDLLLEAIGPVRRRRPLALFVVAGQVLRGEQGEYERRIRALGLGEEDLVARFSYLSTEESIDYVRAADLVVLPYRHIYQSGVLLFAFSFGRPVLATRVGAFPETVEEGLNGWLVEPGDVGALVSRLADLLADPEELERTGERARALADERYDWAGIARRTLKMYREVMGRV